MSPSTWTARAVAGLAAIVIASSLVFGQSPAPPMPDAATLAAVDALYPGVEEILRVRDPRALGRLAGVLTTHPSPESMTMLLWMLRYTPGWRRDYMSAETQLVSVTRVVRDVPIASIAEVWRTGDQEVRETAIIVLSGITQFRSPEDQALRERTLIAALSDSSPRVREFAASALRAIGSADAKAALARAAAAADVESSGGRLRGDETVPALLAALGEPSARSAFVGSVMQALAATGDRAAVPTLERWARSDASVANRTEALRAVVAITRPSNPGAEARRLLWEQPDMAWETEVLNGGPAALPRAWQALASNDERERGAAAALLGWLPDTRSIAPILEALDRAPGAIMRQQLAFDLQVILLEAGEPVDVRDQAQLAGEHLRFLFESGLNAPFDGDLRRRFRRTTAIAIHPDATVSPLSFALEAETAGDGLLEGPGRFRARTQRLATAQLFRESSDEGAIGVAFHPILQRDGAALVATTLTLQNYGGAPVWVSVYRREAGSWTRIRVPAAPFPREPTTLMPAIDRNYGADHPMRRVRLLNRMREIERSGDMSGRLEGLDADLPIGSGQALDASILPLLEPYRQSKVLAVQYTAERHAVALGATPNLPFWFGALEGSPPDEVFRSAIGVIGGYAKQQVASAPVAVSGRDRQQLIAAMQAPVSVNPSLRPRVLPSPGDVDDVRRSERFGLIRVSFGRGIPRGGSGYTMLFERRNDAWVFLCTIDGWMS